MFFLTPSTSNILGNKGLILWLWSHLNILQGQLKVLWHHRPLFPQCPLSPGGRKGGIPHRLLNPELHWSRSIWRRLKDFTWCGWWPPIVGCCGWLLNTHLFLPTWRSSWSPLFWSYRALPFLKEGFLFGGACGFTNATVRALLAMPRREVYCQAGACWLCIILLWGWGWDDIWSLLLHGRGQSSIYFSDLLRLYYSDLWAGLLLCRWYGFVDCVNPVCPDATCHGSQVMSCVVIHLLMKQTIVGTGWIGLQQKCLLCKTMRLTSVISISLFFLIHYY